MNNNWGSSSASSSPLKRGGLGGPGLGGGGGGGGGRTTTTTTTASSHNSSSSSNSISRLTSSIVFVFILFFGAAFIYSRSTVDNSSILTNVSNNILTTNFRHPSSQMNKKPPILTKKPPILTKKPPILPKIIPFNCSVIAEEGGNQTQEGGNQTQRTTTCPANFPQKFRNDNVSGLSSSSSTTCPDYFRWIHEDLRPWKETGITKEMVNRARNTANFRLVIVNGKAYVEVYRKAFQSRDTFTIWGILQLLRMYPGRLPDLDMMFDCVDWPVINAANATNPPPLFRYCANDTTLDIVFPDWSFWGWPEIHIKPWDTLLKELEEGNMKTKWVERDPYAYWKGNPDVAETRQDMMKCNVSDKQDWNARLYAQDWAGESKKGYEQSNLANQCTHRYKIYIEGSAWSVSEKYILACDSLTLLVKPLYYDFFTRGLIPKQHYWPVKQNDKCRSIKFAVDWGNNYKEQAQDIGKAASNFIQKDLRMDYVYDYMFHLLNEYAKLLRYKPSIPGKAEEYCAETMACSADGIEKEFMMESMVKATSDTDPCTLAPPFELSDLQALIKSKEDTIKEVEMWEQKSWQSQPNEQL